MILRPSISPENPSRTEADWLPVLPLLFLIFLAALLSSFSIMAGLAGSPASAQARLVCYLLQALPACTIPGLLLLRAGREPPRTPGKTVAFDGLLFIFLSLLLLLDIFTTRHPLRAGGMALILPVAAAYTFLLSADFSSHPGIRRFGSGILSAPRRLIWLVIPLCGFPLMFSACYALGSAFPELSGPALSFPGFPGGRAAVDVPLAFVTNTVFGGGIGGEPFWRGFLYLQMRRRIPFVQASLIAGLAQAAWMIPVWRLIGIDSPGTIFLFLFFLAASPAAAWIYERSGRSLVAPIVLFGSMTTSLQYIPLTAPALGLTALTFPTFLIITKWAGGARSVAKSREQGRMTPSAGPRK